MLPIITEKATFNPETRGWVMAKYIGILAMVVMINTERNLKFMG